MRRIIFSGFILALVFLTTPAAYSDANENNPAGQEKPASSGVTIVPLRGKEMAAAKKAAKAKSVSAPGSASETGKPSEATDQQDTGTPPSEGSLTPPGISKKGELPKGLEKQGKTPAGWEKGKKLGWTKDKEEKVKEKEEKAKGEGKMNLLDKMKAKEKEKGSKSSGKSADKGKKGKKK